MNDTKLNPVKSSMFKALGYNDDVSVLTLEFHSGLILAYQGISEEMYATMMTAPSLGHFYNEQIKGQFESLTVAEPPPKPLKIAGEEVRSGTELTWDEVGSGSRAQSENSQNPDFSYKGEHGIPDPETGCVPANTRECFVHMQYTEHWERPDGSWVCQRCHPKPGSEQSPQDAATAPNGAPAGVMAVPQVLAPVEPPKTPAEAIRLLTEQDGLIQATIAKSNEIAQDAMTVRVTDARSYADAGERLRFLAECQDRAVKFLDPIRAMLLKPYQAAQERLKAASSPLETAKQHVSRQRVIWADEQERIRQAEQDRLRREAEAAAEEERKARGEQMTLGAVEDALAQGDTTTAERLIAEPISAAPTYIPPAFVESTVPETKGVSKRKNWKAEVTSLEDLVLDIASGICSLRDGKGLQGHAPLTFIEINQTALNQSAKSMEKAMQYPGVRAFNDASESVRRKK